MKYPNNENLSPLFEFECKKEDLKPDRQEEQSIISIEKIYRIVKLGDDKTKKKKPSKNTGISLFPDECDEFLEDKREFNWYNHKR